jgi:spermidine synthase
MEILEQLRAGPVTDGNGGRRSGRRTMVAFYFGLSLICACTLMYEVVLTRLLSVLCWYYLAFVSISMAMFGMTAGALAVQLFPGWFKPSDISSRLAQAAFAMAVSMPVALVIMLAVPLDVSLAVETLFSFLLFSAVIAVPFFFSGVVVCLSLTRTPFPIGRVYFADLVGAGAGCLASVLLLKLIDAPSGIFAISALLFLGAACYATYAGDRPRLQKSYIFAIGMLIVAGLNASTLHGIQPIWSKGRIDRRDKLIAEVWNPISKVRASRPVTHSAHMWGPSPLAPDVMVTEIGLDIDNDAYTPIMRFDGDLKPFAFLRYDVTSLAAGLRAGGSAAIIGVGGGRDVINCAVNGFRRIVGIEVNSAIVGLDTRRFNRFSGFSKIPNFEIHSDEGRSYLTRNNEKFDMIQASLVDTWAATSAGALTLSENSLYTVDAWQIFDRHLKPGGLITFSRWYWGPEAAQTYRLFSVAWAMLLTEGVTDPSRNIALVASDRVATILVSNQALSEEDLHKIRTVAEQMEFKILFLPGEETPIPELRTIASTRTLGDMARLRDAAEFDYSPVFDSSPYFFNAVRLRNVPRLLARGGHGTNLRALMFVFAFMVAALILVALTIVLPLKRWASRQGGVAPPVAGGIAYFVGIGMGFMLVEMAMMQQLSIFLGHPIYSLVVVLAGLILSTGVGSLVSDRLHLASNAASRMPALAVTLILILYSLAVIPVIHRFIAETLWQRAFLSLALVAPCGFLMGFCFPVGLRWMTVLNQEENLPWMWALNGAAATLGSFVAIILSMETSIVTCGRIGAACYLLAAIVLPSSRAVVQEPLT